MSKQKELYGNMHWVVMRTERKQVEMSTLKYKVEHPLAWLFLGRTKKDVRQKLEAYKSICWGLAFAKPDTLLAASAFPLERLTAENFWHNVEITVSDDAIESLNAVYFNEEVLKLIEESCSLAQRGSLIPLSRPVVDGYVRCPFWVKD